MFKNWGKYVFKILCVLSVSIGILSFYQPKKIKAYNVGGNSPIIGLNISAIGYEYEKIFEYTDLELKDGLTYFRCTSQNQDPCTQWTNGATNQTFQLEWNIDHNSTDYKVMLYEYEFILDDYYVGYIVFTNSLNIDSQMSTSHATRSYYVNGNSFTISGTTFMDTWTVERYDLTQKDLVDLSTIERLLTDIDNNTDNLESLTTTNNNYLNELKTTLNILTNYIQNYTLWSFPIESLLFVNHCFDNGLTVNGINNYNSYNYPIFLLKTNDKIINQREIGANGLNYIIFLIDNYNLYNATTFNQLFTISNSNVTPVSFSTNFISPGKNPSGQSSRIIKIGLQNNSNTTQFFDITYKASVNRKFMPIFFGTSNQSNISTDFALYYGLSNRLLDNLDLIANGNTQSSNAIFNADVTNSNARDTFQQEEELISNAESDLNSKLNDLNISSQNNNLFGNSKFIASAQWVKTQFDYFTTNNAYGYLITFSLVIGISLVIIGKLRG